MENRIDQIRQEMKYYFNPALALDEPAETFHSPDGTYSLEVSFYRMEDPERNWNVARGIVRRTADNHVLFDLLRSHDSAWHWWITQQNRNYLVWGEALEGYSIIDLDNEQLAGYSSEEDPFIWTEVFPSEDKTLLAVVGCYWGSSFGVVIYDFSSPMEVPFDQPGSFGLEDRGINRVIGWQGNEALRCLDEDGNELVIRLDEMD